jgi:probable HAF family extracellular repeat protein
MVRAIARCLVLCVILTAAADGYCAILYSVVDLGTLGGGFSEAFALNNLGHVTGRSTTSSGQIHAFHYNGASMTDLGTLGGTQSEGNGINDSDLVVGWSYNASGNTRAFYYSGSITDIGTLGGNHGLAYDVDNAGVIVGELVDNSPRPFQYSGTITTLANPTGGTGYRARAINNTGQIAAYVGIGSGARAFIYDGATRTDLGTLGGDISEPFDINATGHVVGYAQLIPATGNPTHAFFYDGTTMVDLGGSSFSAAYALDDADNVVGTDNGVAFLYQGAGLVDLNTLISPSSGWFLQSAQDINNNGQIVGYGTHDGQHHAFLLNPVPEPSGIVLAALAAAALAWSSLLKWRRPGR